MNKTSGHIGSAAMIAAAVFGVVACSSSDNKGNPGGGDGGAPPPGGSTKTGAVTVSSVRTAQDFSSYNADAVFFEAASGTNGDGAGDYNCHSTTEGACQLRVCDYGAPVDGGIPMNPTIVQAGAVTISGGPFTSPIVLSPDSNDAKYPEYTGGAATWSAANGDEIAIHADGSSEGAPTFQAALKAPSLVSLSSPSWGAMTGPNIPRDQDLQLAWTSDGTASGNVRTSISTLTLGAGLINFLTCLHPVSASNGTVPAALLGKLPKGQYNFEVDIVQSQHLTPGDWQIDVSLVDLAGTPEGGSAKGFGLLE